MTLPFRATVASSLLLVATGSALANNVLGELRDKFAAARALPLGSRPGPPSVDLKPLIGVSESTLAHYLGGPTSIDCGELFRTHQDTCSAFRYGPDPAPVEEHDGYITLKTGGPWLLVVATSHGRIVDVRWLGQR